MKDALIKINPCGLNSNVYSSVEEMAGKKYTPVSFNELILNKLVE